MKLLLTLDFPPVRGGIQRYLYDIVKHTYGPVDEVIIARPRCARACFRDLPATIRGVDFPGSRQYPKLSLIGALAALAPRWLLARGEFIVEAGNVYAGLAPWVLSFVMRRPYRVYAYGAELLGLRRAGLRAGVLRSVLRRAAEIVVLGDFTRSLLHAGGVDRPTVAVPPRIDADPATVRSAAARRSAQPGAAGLRILAVGRLVGHKGHRVLLDSCAMLGADQPWSCTVVGEGPCRAALRAQAVTLGIDQRVNLPGDLPDTALAEEYRRASVFVLPSLDLPEGVEGFGIVLLEAMAAGIPIVASRTGGVPEVVGETALLVEPDDPAALARAIKRIAGDRQYAADLVTRASERLLQRFTWPGASAGTARPRILFLNHWAARLGGAEYSLLDLLSCAVKQSDAHLATTESGPLVDRARDLGVTCHLLPCPRGLSGVRRWGMVWRIVSSWPELLGFAGYVRELRRLVAQLDPAVVHANVPKSHVAAMLAVRAECGSRLILHIREIFDRGSLPPLLYAALVPPRARVIAISHAVKAGLPRRLAVRATVVHNGVAAPAHTLPPPAPPFRLIYLGRIVPWKGCHDLIEIFAALLKHPGIPAATLDLVGDTAYWSPSYRDNLEALIGRTAGHCRLRAHTGDPLGELQAHHVFCNASRNEPFGRSIAEAQACGLPVVSYDSGGVGEIVEPGRTGLLVPDGDTGAFVVALAGLLQAPERIAAMGTAARERARLLFNREIQGPKILTEILSA